MAQITIPLKVSFRMKWVLVLLVALRAPRWMWSRLVVVEVGGKRAR